MLSIRESVEEDRSLIRSVVSAAFSSDVEADLVEALMSDPTARPLYSLLALEEGVAAGHILFTSVRLEPATDLVAVIMAPVSVIPNRQRKGIGSAMINTGLKQLANSGVDLIFVLGHPAYYSQHDFSRADAKGFLPPYSIPDSCMPAWMVRRIGPELSTNYSGKVICAEALSKPEYWRE